MFHHVADSLNYAIEWPVTPIARYGATSDSCRAQSLGFLIFKSWHLW